jgi:hypothetical protein
MSAGSSVRPKRAATHRCVHAAQQKFPVCLSRGPPQADAAPHNRSCRKIARPTPGLGRGTGSHRPKDGRTDSFAERLKLSGCAGRERTTVSAETTPAQGSPLERMVRELADTWERRAIEWDALKQRCPEITSMSAIYREMAEDLRAACGKLPNDALCDGGPQSVESK